jgi:cytochrome c-type biogenesis protein CcmH
MPKYIIILIICSIFTSDLYAQNNQNFKNDALIEEKAKDLYKELRCLVCQNQSLSESDAPLAIDLRALIREKLEQGKTKKEVIKYLVDRYGEFILLKPALSLQNLILWVSPLIFLLIGLIFAYKFYSGLNKNTNKNNRLSEKEKKEVYKTLSRRKK